METSDIVSKDQNVHSGDLVFAGTRVPAERIINALRANYTLDAALADFPGVQREQVEAFLSLALELAEELDHEKDSPYAHSS